MKKLTKTEKIRYEKFYKDKIKLSNLFCKEFNISNGCIPSGSRTCKICSDLHSLLHIDPFCVDHG